MNPFEPGKDFPPSRASGFGFLWVIVALVVVGSILASLGTLVSKGQVVIVKAKQGREAVEAAVDAVVGYGEANGHLPGAGEAFLATLPNHKDSWDQALLYLYDSQAATSDEISICSRTSTSLAITGTRSIRDVAFIILSGGNNYNIQTANSSADSHWGGAVSTPTTVTLSPKGELADHYRGHDDPGGASVRLEPYDDIVQWVTLPELQARIDCANSQASAPLQILNTRLPAGEEGKAYPVAHIYAEGGVPFESDKYAWCYTGSLPDHLHLSVSANCGSDADKTLAPYALVRGRMDCNSGQNAPYPITFHVTDASGNTRSKTLKLEVAASPGQCGADQLN
ncbi:MAG: hypothetical protein HQL52_12635 [Magnetococcales bacterium]|nr:hypothetical protein [Magnetococcales bacterium]